MVEYSKDGFRTLELLFAFEKLHCYIYNLLMMFGILQNFIDNFNGF